MSFLRHEEIYRSDVGTRRDREQRTLSLLPALIGFDEFPVGYSLAGCHPGRACLRFTDQKLFSTINAVVQLFFSQSLFGTFLHEATRGEIIVDAGQIEDEMKKIGANYVQAGLWRGYREISLDSRIPDTESGRRQVALRFAQSCCLSSGRFASPHAREQD
jgi:hypothetical protein